jgi:hypothetical protein
MDKLYYPRPIIGKFPSLKFGFDLSLQYTEPCSQTSNLFKEYSIDEKTRGRKSHAAVP